MSPEKRVIPPQKSNSGHDSAQELCDVFGKMNNVFDGTANGNVIFEAWSENAQNTLKMTITDLFTAIHYKADGVYKNVSAAWEQEEVWTNTDSQKRYKKHPKRIYQMRFFIRGDDTGTARVPKMDGVDPTDATKTTRSMIETMLKFLKNGVTNEEELKAKGKTTSQYEPGRAPKRF